MVNYVFYGLVITKDYWPTSVEQYLIMFGISIGMLPIATTFAFGWRFFSKIGQKVKLINLYAMFFIIAYIAFSLLWPYNVPNYIMIALLIVLIVVNTKKGMKNKHNRHV